MYTKVANNSYKFPQFFFSSTLHNHGLEKQNEYQQTHHQGQLKQLTLWSVSIRCTNVKSSKKLVSLDLV